MGRSGWRHPTPTVPMPVPSQDRARDTIRAAVEAAADLLDRSPVHEVTLEAVRQRAGVSQGSLRHHFGDRDGLIAAAQVERYRRSCATDAAFFAPLAGAVTSSAHFADVMLGFIDDMLTPERREARWLRITAVAAGLNDDQLLATLRHNATMLIDHLSMIVIEGLRQGVLLPDTDPRTLASLASMHAQGLMLDDLAGDDSPPSGWRHFQVRFLCGFLPEPSAQVLTEHAQVTHGDLWRAEVIGPPGRIPHMVAGRLAELRAGMTPATAAEDLTDARVVRDLLARQAPSTTSTELLPSGPARLLELAVLHVREHGAQGLDVKRLREESGLRTNTTFHRAFDGHQGVLRAARASIELDRAANSVSRFAGLVATAASPAEFRDALTRWGSAFVDSERRRTLFQRAETIAAARTDAVLRGVLAPTQRACRDLLIEQVCLAQARGLIDPTLPASAVARFLDGAVWWHLFHELDERRSGRDAWLGMLRRIAAMLSPDRSSAG